jgi:hypothetical protein
MQDSSSMVLQRTGKNESLVILALEQAVDLGEEELLFS